MQNSMAFGNRLGKHFLRFPRVLQLQNVKLHQSCRQCQQSKIHLRQKPDAPKGYLLLAIPVFTFCLGTWQVRRRAWKLNLIKSLEERTMAEPIPFPDVLEELKDLEYRKVIVRGTFDHSKELYVTPRSPITDAEGGGGLVSTQGNIGAQVITPFHLSNRDLTILVNRGWVPREMCDPAKRPAGQIEGEVELVAVVRNTEKRPPFGSKNDPAKNSWHNRDIEVMAETVGASPYFLDADAKSTVTGGPLGGQTRVTLRNEHLSYIFTWYTLSLATFAMWYTKFRKAPVLK